jgi:two-component system, cell cycle sensor histidine kinase and response regulator CckA
MDRSSGDRKRIELDELQSQKFEGIGQLAAGIAHDFNNILSVILNFSSFVAEALPEGSPARDDVKEIQQAAARGAAITRQLLVFSRRDVVKPEVLNLNNVLIEFSRFLRTAVGEQTEVTIELAPDLWNAEIDPGQFQLALMNLAVNSRDAMPNGGAITVRTSNAILEDTFAHSHVGVVAGRYVLVEVSDTGCGIDPEVVERIFEPYFTTKPKGKGTGLGLSMVYGIVKRAHGNIWAYSEVGVGTTFKIYLPCADKTEEIAVGGEKPNKHLRGVETILVVEDETGVRNAIRRMLEKNGYKVLEAHNGTQALEVAEKYDGPIPLLLTDVIMPEISGRELAGRLILRRPDLKTLYMSGYNDHVIAYHGLVAESGLLLQKPFTENDLLSKIRKTLGKD